ncbi:unnamed protein product [Rhizophagus irregularis]|nr:unnamed protein product [Rhizophagus irregularis]
MFLPNVTGNITGKRPFGRPSPITRYPYNQNLDDKREITHLYLITCGDCVRTTGRVDITKKNFFYITSFLLSSSSRYLQRPRPSHDFKIHSLNQTIIMYN